MSTWLRICSVPLATTCRTRLAPVTVSGTVRAARTLRSASIRSATLLPAAWLGIQGRPSSVLSRWMWPSTSGGRRSAPPRSMPSVALPTGFNATMRPSLTSISCRVPSGRVALRNISRSSSADPGTHVFGGVEDGHGDHLVEPGRAVGELLQLVVEVDLLLPHRRLERAPALRRGVGVEGETHRDLQRPDLVLALEGGKLLHQHVDRRLGVGMHEGPAARCRAQEGGQHLGLFLDGALGGVERARVEPDAIVPQAQLDAVGPQDLDGG